nr:DUF4268 domain-containing protein [uncultured Moellerella sp.]
MYKVDRPTNSLHSLQEVSFSSLGFHEREHLQEWLAKNPQALTKKKDINDELLIIQKEFAGFDYTKERLDLLALDKEGNLVIIENKLDDSGRDVVWQALKYAGYCANLRKEQILDIFQRYLDKYNPEENRSASEIIIEFLNCDSLDGVQLNKSLTQRVILVAASFKKEITNTALWLIQFGLQVQCFKITPYQFGKDIFININQVIPTPEAESYMIGIAQKEAEERSINNEMKQRNQIFQKFWAAMLEQLRANSCTLFNNISPANDTALSANAPIAGLSYYLIFIKKEIRIELYISRKNAEINTFIFDWLFEHKQSIESKFGHSIQWQALEGKKACRLAFTKTITNQDESYWPEIINWFLINITALEKAITPLITPLNLAINQFFNGQEVIGKLDSEDA